MNISKNIYKGITKERLEADGQKMGAFRILPISDEEQADITQHLQLISGILSIHGATWESVHPFHPMNISRFAYQWFYLGAKDEADFAMSDEQMCLSLGIALGQFARDMFGMHWCNVANVEKMQGDLIPVEYALCATTDLDVPYTPISMLVDEVREAKLGQSVVLLQIISERICPDFDLKNSAQNVAELNFGNLLYYAKMTDMPDDLYRLYTAVLTLDKWYFVATEIGGQDLVVNELDGRKKYLAFVDEQDAWRYAMDRTRVRAKSINESLALLQDSQGDGVEGIQFTSGDDTWYFPTESMLPIVDELKEAGRL